MAFGAFVRVPNGSHSTPSLAHGRSLYEQSRCFPPQYHRLNASSHTFVTLPSKYYPCKATLKEADSNIEAVEKVKGIPSEYSREMELSNLTAISSLDGRQWNKVKDLACYLSEYSLIYYLNLVEIKWLLKLSQIPEICEVPRFSEEAQLRLQGLIDGFSIADAMEVKNIERITDHNVKAVEYFLKTKCQDDPELAKVHEFFHFGCTAEAINNLAHALMLKEAINTVILPITDEFVKGLYNLTKANAHFPMRAWMRGQPASPTTLGMEMVAFAERLNEGRRAISKAETLGMCAGAVGNYNAHVVAYPDVNWPEVFEQFVASLGLSFDPYVTQIEPHDNMAKLFQSLIHFNHILLAFVKDICGYISVGYFQQAGEIGPSTPPHNVNPIDFENSEGNLGIANAHLSMNLPTSDWQGDLTDSTVVRNIGVALAYSVFAYKSALAGIGKLQVNEAALNRDLDKSWEALAEPIQMMMIMYGVEEPHEKLKELTRGRAVTRESITQFINGLEIPVQAKSQLLKLTSHNYIGVAVQLVEDAYSRAMDSTLN